MCTDVSMWGTLVTTIATIDNDVDEVLSRSGFIFWGLEGAFALPPPPLGKLLLPLPP